LVASSSIFFYSPSVTSIVLSPVAKPKIDFNFSMLIDSSSIGPQKVFYYH